MRSLITGGRGFVGTWLADHLRSSGDDVVQIDQEVEITDPAALLAAVRSAAPDAIYHLAAMTHVGQSWDEPLRVLEVNVLGTGALLAAARECGTDPRVLVTSSAEVYGAVTDPSKLPLTEDVAHGPAHPLRGLQAGRRGPVRPGVARSRPARGDRAAVQPHRAGPVAELRRVGPGQAHRRRRAVRRRRDPGGQPVRQAGLHRRPGRRPVLPDAHRVRGAGRASTTCARAGTWPSRRSPTASWRRPAARSGSCRTRR